MALPQYDYLRKQAKQASDTQRQESQDALSRRFAAQGMLQSGAYLKGQESVDQEANKQYQDTLGQIGFAETNEQQRQSEVKQGQDFQREMQNSTQGLSRELFDKDLAFKKEVSALDDKYRNAELVESKRSNDINALLGLANAQLDDENWWRAQVQFNSKLKR